MTDKNTSSPADDFIIGKVIGEGSYGIVRYATERATGKAYALKILEKSHIIKEKKAKYVSTEKSILNKVRHPNVITLFRTFQDELRLYFVLEYCPNGEVRQIINQFGGLNQDCVRFYTAEMISAIEYLHSQHIIHRDLKPENMLFDENMHLKLIDFGTAKCLENESEGTLVKTFSFVGTAEYVSPELLNDYPADYSSDLWALGCILFQLTSGRSPFKGETDYATFQLILSLTLEYPEDFPADTRDLVDKLLVLDPTQRLGVASFEPIKKHKLFGDDFPWESLHTQTPPQIIGRICSQVIQENPEEEISGEDENSDETRSSKSPSRNPLLWPKNLASWAKKRIKVNK
eukprot:TRINITY_DN816_c0_g1_i1.p1 TRINITY_DN816_c0_g1~~TRINITY_DN816_c0_g1_i1.p1  ORF type:complete len:355 (+),score=50.43 TRINITY_DN816_c0_g1_i1:30-1067(+)